MFKRAYCAITALALLAAAGCGEDGGTEPEGSIAVSASPTLLTVPQGQSGTVNVILTRGGGFADPVTVTAEGFPAGVTATVSPASLTGATATATVTVSVASTVAAGSYTGTIRASATGVGAATAQVTLTVTETPNYALSTTPATLTIPAGGNATTTVNINRTNFPGAVSLSVVSPPAGITAAFNPAAPTANTSTATINVASTVAPGSYTISIAGAGSAGDRTTTVALTVTPAPSFTFSASPNVVSAVAGGSGSSTVSIVRTNLTADVALSLVNPPAGITGVFTPAALSGTTLASTLAINVAGTVAAGTYLLTLQGAAGTLTQTAPIALSVVTPSVAFATNPPSLLLERGASGTSTLTITRIGFTGSIIPAVSGKPAAMTVAFNPSPITVNSADIVVTVGSSVTPGTYNVVIDASGTPGNPSATLVVTVLSSGGGGNIVWEFCNNEVLPIKFWRKSNGSWAEVTGSVVGNTTRYEFTATGNDAGVAFTRQITGLPATSMKVVGPRATFDQVTRQARENAQSARARIRNRNPDVGALALPYFETSVLYAVSSELAGQARTCDGTASVSKTFTVAGMAAGEVGLLGYGPGASTLLSNRDYSLMVPPGTYDYLAAFGPSPVSGAPQSWTHYRLGRGETAPGPTVAINRTGATPFVAAPFTITGGATGSVYRFLQSIQGARGNIVTLSTGTTTATSGNMPFLAAVDRRPTDMNVFFASNVAQQGTNDISSRAITQFLGSAPPAGTTAFALPPAVPSFGITNAGSAPYPTWSIVGSIPAAFQTEVGSITASYQGSGETTLLFHTATRVWLISQGMATNYTLTGPQGLPGFLTAWAPADPLLEGDVTMFSSNITGGVPVAGSVNITSHLFRSPP